MVHRLQKVKYIVLALILLSCLTGVYGKLTGTSPWDVFSMITAGRLPDSKYLVGIILLILIILLLLVEGDNMDLVITLGLLLLLGLADDRKEEKQGG